MENAIERHRAMVQRAANIHWNRIKNRCTTLDLDDLIQVGLIALVLALKRVNPDAGSERSFLWKTVYLCIQREITAHHHTLYVSHRFKRYASQIWESGELDDAGKWAQKLNITPQHAQEMLCFLTTQWHSFDKNYDVGGDQPFSLHEIIGKPDDTDEDDAWEKIFERLCKTDFERSVLKLMYEGYVQREIGEITGRPEYSVYKAYRRIKERYSGGITNGTTKTPRTQKAGGPRATIHGRRA